LRSSKPWLNQPDQGVRTTKVIELTSSSAKSIEDAVEPGIQWADVTLD